jgi:hypothetical protein
MAEVLGVVASSIAVGQLASHIITSSEKLYNFGAASRVLLIMSQIYSRK